MVEPTTSAIEAELYAKLASRFVSDDQMRKWLQDEAIPGFSGLTGKDLLSLGRADQLISFVDAVDAGIFS